MMTSGEKNKLYRERKKIDGFCTFSGCWQPLFSKVFCRKHLLAIRENHRAMTDYQGLNTGRKPLEIGEDL
jgi:hypothetical protein